MTEATAEALAPESVVEVSSANEDAELAAIYAKAQEEPGEPVETEAQDQTPEAEVDEAAEDDQPVEQPAEEVRPPSELPRALRDHWKDIPEQARKAFVDSQREANLKLTEQGRLMQGIAPIRDALVEAARQMPALADMKPQDVAREVFQLAQMSQQFSEKPVETMIGLIRQHKLEDAVRQALSGEPATQESQYVNSLQNEIKSLKQQVARFGDPEYLRNQVAQVTTETRLIEEVSKFAETADHWSEVEHNIPVAIQFVQQMRPEASPQDVLKAAYDLAVSQAGLQSVPMSEKASEGDAAIMAAQVSNPEKAKAALKAKSVNVTSRPNGKQRDLSEDEMLASVWSRMQS